MCIVLYVSDVHGSTFWLDHVICSRDMHNLIKKNIPDKPPSSNHLPLSTVFNITLNDNLHVKKVIKWCDASHVSLDKYKMLTKNLFLKCTYNKGIAMSSRADAMATSLENRNDKDFQSTNKYYVTWSSKVNDCVG